MNSQRCIDDALRDPFGLVRQGLVFFVHFFVLFVSPLILDL